MLYESQVQHSEEKTHVITGNHIHNQAVDYLLTNSRGTIATRYGGPRNTT